MPCREIEEFGYQRLEMCPQREKWQTNYIRTCIHYSSYIILLLNSSNHNHHQVCHFQGCEDMLLKTKTQLSKD